MDPVELLVDQPDRPDVARRLLAAAERAGVDPVVVKSTSDGFIVPEPVYELAYTGVDPGEPAAEAPTGTSDTAPEPAADTPTETSTEAADPAGGKRKRGKGA